MLKRYLSFLILFLPIIAFGQKSFLKGTVTDKDENPAIANIVITGPNLKNGFTGAQTDEEGSFGLDLPYGTYTVN
jgi:hypothetical protein